MKNLLHDFSIYTLSVFVGKMEVKYKLKIDISIIPSINTVAFTCMRNGQLFRFDEEYTDLFKIEDFESYFEERIRVISEMIFRY